MKNWNFGIIGAGLIADFHAKAIRDIPNAKLLACCDKIPEKSKKLAENYGIQALNSYQEMLESDEIDIVTIATPSGFHAEPVIAAAQAGKHVLCEKPLDISLERIDSMIEAHEKAGTYLGGIFPYRYNDYISPLRDAINTGRFGKITYAAIYVPWWRSDEYYKDSWHGTWKLIYVPWWRSDEYYKDSWHGTWKLDGGGALMNQSIHMVDMLCDLMPPVESLQAFTATLGHKIETEDTAAAVLRFAGGTLGIIYGTTASYPGQFRRFEISGTKGTVVNVENSITLWQFFDETPNDREILTRFGKIEGGGGVADPAAITHENHTRNFKEFLKALETNTKFSIDGREARKAVELILAIYKSAREQRIVMLEC